MNKTFVAEWKKAFGADSTPDFFAVGGYDGMAAIVHAVSALKGKMDGDQAVIGTVTLVYDHDSHDLAHELMDLQHHHHEAIVCTTHVHMDAKNCLEVVVVRGPASEVRQIGDRLISTRGVKHGRLTCSTTGRALR